MNRKVNSERKEWGKNWEEKSDFNEIAFRFLFAIVALKPVRV